MLGTLDRRRCVQTIFSLGATLGSQFHWQSELAAQIQATGKRRHLVILWMPGGPSQLDTWDLKPGHANGGPFRELQTTVPGMRFSEHLPALAQWAHHLAIVRSMRTKEGDHSRGTYLVRTGQAPGQPVRFPAVPAAIGKELAPSTTAGTPGYVSILPSTFLNPSAFGAGFLGAGCEPLTVQQMGEGAMGQKTTEDQDVTADSNRMAELQVENLRPPSDLPEQRTERRRRMWNMLQQSYAAPWRGSPAVVHDTVYRRAMQLADSSVVDAFDLNQESEEVRRSYGTSAFGQGCLMARRLIEYGVPVVEVALELRQNALNWDTHQDNFPTVKRLSGILDRAWGRLMQDLHDRGLLQHTTVLWMGEFGRTPEINRMGGRDHFPNAWSCVLAGAGIQGGAILGRTSTDGREIIDRPVSVPELLATVCRAVGIDPHRENVNEDGRPLKIVDGLPIAELLDVTANG
ncbi:MAG: hypothetical protein KatS3mg111_1775 [Pirellulaceae bacterium]|nr:MAG: hypothetical protein KatS3mg111_1775 [Pirellulaceae bacterium]